MPNDLAEQLPNSLSDLLTVLDEPAFPDFVQKLIRVIEDHLHSNGSNVPASRLRLNIHETITELVARATHADCVFLRKQNNDGSARIIPGTCRWPSGKPHGMLPLEKEKGEGISSLAAESNDGVPIIVRDILDLPSGDRFAAAHQATIAKWKDRKDEDVVKFLTFIRAECCIPLRIKDKLIATVIVVRGSSYSEAEAEAVLTKAKKLQPLLEFLYYVAWQLEVREHDRAGLSELTQLVPVVVDCPSQMDRLLKIATILTCEPGLQWHRAMIFSFTGPYPSDATCVMALGEDGNRDRRKNHDGLTSSLRTIEDYFKSSLNCDLGKFDCLFHLVTGVDDSALTIPAAIIASFSPLHKICRNPRAETISAFLPEGVLTVEDDNPFLTSLPWYSQAFAGSARSCERCIVPLFDYSAQRVIGFVLLDNPYHRRAEHNPDKVLTRVVCDLFAPHLATIGFGTKQWVEEYREGVSIANSLIDDDPSQNISSEKWDRMQSFIAP